MFFLRGGGVDVRVGRLVESALYSRLRTWCAPIDTVGPIDWYPENPN